MTEESVDVELLGQSAFHKLTHGFAIRDRLRDVLVEQQAIERQYLQRDNRWVHLAHGLGGVGA